jgi:hypothetical protein
MTIKDKKENTNFCQELNRLFTEKLRSLSINENTMEESSQNRQMSGKIADRADSIEFKKKPASLVEIILMNLIYGISVKLVQSENYERTPEDIDEKIEIISLEKGLASGNKEEVGHAVYIDHNGNKIENDSELNDCYYQVYSKILQKHNINKTPNCIRKEIAEEIRKHQCYEHILDKEQLIYDLYPFEANTLLYTVGIERRKQVDGQDYLEVQDKDIEEFSEAVNKNRRGEPYTQIFNV